MLYRFYFLFSECTISQRNSGCCEKAFEESSGGNIEWIKKDNGNGGKWITEPDFIQFNIADDAKCNGKVTQPQTGNATLKFDNSDSKTIVLSMAGRAEANYEKFLLYVDDELEAKVQAVNGGEDGCKVNTCKMCHVIMEEQEFILTPGPHNIRVEIDTVDGSYHKNAYFRITFKVKQKDVCKSCECPKPGMKYYIK